MRRLVIAALALIAIGLNVGSAKASPITITDSDSTCPNTYQVCVNFTLSYDSGSSLWTLTTDYVSSPSGLLTATGAYYNAGKTAPNFDIGNLTLVNPPSGWQAGTGCSDLNMNNGTTDLLSACESTTNGINGAISPGTTLSLTFTANSAFASAVNGGQIDYRAHIQAYGPTGCSIKVDTGVQGGIGSAGDNCEVPPPPSVPEPATLALFAAGLAGLGWTLGRRRKQI